MLSPIYLKELGAGLALYVGLLALSITALIHGGIAPDWRYVVAVAPMLGGLACARAIMRQLNRLDELQRRVQLDGLATSFLGTALVTFSYGFLENAGLPRLSMFVVWPLMAAFWIVGTLAANRRYRP